MRHEAVVHRAGIALLCALFAAAAFAQSKGQASVADVATYQGPDRQQRLVEAAKREGFVSLYN